MLALVAKMPRHFKQQQHQQKKKRFKKNGCCLSAELLRKCGQLPTNSSNLYKFKYSVLRDKQESVAKEAIFELPSHVNDIVDLKILTVGYTTEYDYTTVYKFDEVKENIENIIILKNELEKNQQMCRRNSEKLDIYKNLLNTQNIFYNRCSIKLLNLNCIFENIIAKAMVDGVFYVDLCCAPGGFTHFLMSYFKNVNITAYLTSMHQVSSFLSIDYKALNAVKRNNTLHIIEGDILEKKFRDTFQKNVVEKVSFVLADGGIDFSKKENYQEFYSRHLCLAQMIVGMTVLKDGGFIICKYFDLFSKYMATMLYIISFVFEEIKITKPDSSKCGNAERYILFKNFKPDVKIMNFLEDVLKESIQHEKEEDGMIITSMISETELNSNKFLNFSKKLTNVNKYFNNLQFTALQKYLDYIKIPDKLPRVYTVYNHDSL